MTSSRRRARDAWQRVRRPVLARRRLLAALLAFLAVGIGLHTVRPPAPITEPMVVARTDLAAGALLTAQELTTEAVPPGVRPADATADPVGRTLAGPIGRGEPVTDERLVGPALTRGRPVLQGVPVRLPDADMAALLRIGDRIDLVATDPQGGAAQTVASGAVVLALPEASGGVAAGQEAVTSTGLSGRLIVVGVAETQVTAVAAAGVRAFLTYAFAR